MNRTHRYEFRQRSTSKYDNVSPSPDNDSDSDYDDNPRKSERFKKRKISHKNIALDMAKLQKTNDSLPSKPFEIDSWNSLFKLSTICHDQRLIFKDCQKLAQIHDILKGINDMIGLHDLKDAFMHVLTEELQRRPPNCPDDRKDNYLPDTGIHYRNIILYGRPGCGKTTLSKWLSKLYARLNYRESDELTIGSRFNMYGNHLGDSTENVQILIQNALQASGVLLIDEVHNLNDNRTDQDSYGLDIVQCLVTAMDHHKEDLVIIMAGYEDEIKQNILGADDGLARRIGMHIYIDLPTPEQLSAIFMKRMTDAGFIFPKNCQFGTVEWFASHMDSFPNAGGSVENLIHKIRMALAPVVFGCSNKTTLTEKVLQKGFNTYTKFST